MRIILAAGAVLVAFGIGALLIREIASNFSKHSAAEHDGRELFRDLILSIFAIGGLLLLAIRLVDGSGLNTEELDNMGDYVDDTQTALVALLAFLICYGLTSAVIKGVFPDKGTRRNHLLSEATAVVLSLVLSLTVATNSELNHRLSRLIEDRGADAVYTFLVIVFVSVGAFLAWKRVSTVVRPAGRVRGGIRGIREKDGSERS